ncbi:bestrophin-2a-like [Centruroides vittatus]|uniref:bestrophin-2a-like n=1 Tax=Centruroides vittatus TaxID=120091 RepID=UPI0035101F91
MTVSYQYDVASSTSGGFMRLLFRWRGSVWKLVYREMLIFTSAYILLTILYRYFLLEMQKRVFERIVFFCSTFLDLIPLSFVLGFYVSFTASRWWNQYVAIPWPDKLMNILALYVNGVDDTSRMLRRTFMRYLNCTLVLVLRSISMAVKRRFPTKDHLVEAGFLTKLELEMLQSVPSTEFNTFWIPCTWFINLLRDAKQSGHVNDSNGLKLIMEEFNDFRGKCGMLWSYDWISVPLVYTQVVTLATYAFYVACIFGRQYVDNTSDFPPGHRFEYYLPIFTILQLFFYMGLLKVAEQLINPFGDDDEDFELNWIIDRHIKVSYLGIDTLNGIPPPLIKDNYFDELDIKLPYTAASVSYKKKTYRGSVAKMHVPEEQQNLVLPDIPEEEDEDKFAEQFGLTNRRASTWTIVGGKFHNRMSASQLNIDSNSLESGVENWKASNYSINRMVGSKQLDKTTPGIRGYGGSRPTEIVASPDQMDKESMISYGSLADKHMRSALEKSLYPSAIGKPKSARILAQPSKTTPNQGRMTKLFQRAKKACTAPQKSHPTKYKWTAFSPEARPTQEGISLCNLPRGSVCDDMPDYHYQQDSASLFNFRRASRLDDIPTIQSVTQRPSLPSEMLPPIHPNITLSGSQDIDVLIHTQSPLKNDDDTLKEYDDETSAEEIEPSEQYKPEDIPEQTWMYSQSMPNVTDSVFIFEDPEDEALIKGWGDGQMQDYSFKGGESVSIPDIDLVTYSSETLCPEKAKSTKDKEPDPKS